MLLLRELHDPAPKLLFRDHHEVLTLGDPTLGARRARSIESLHRLSRHRLVQVVPNHPASAHRLS